MTSDDQVILQYHQATKHHFKRYARGPGYLDWASQPDPFRRYRGAELILLPLDSFQDDPPYEHVLQGHRIQPVPLSFSSISQLFYDSLALSAWKSAGGEAWALRVNPSSGNLHPTEGYLLCPPVEEISRQAVVAHYAPKEHGLEIRAQISSRCWNELSQDLGGEVLLIGLTSIHWREAWKYGERAYRYCQHDVGHALAAVDLAAAALGWSTRLLDGQTSEELKLLLGLGDSMDAEPEIPDALIAVFPGGGSAPTCRRLRGDAVASFKNLTWNGKPNQLSTTHVEWPIIEEVSTACQTADRPSEVTDMPSHGSPLEKNDEPASTAGFRRVVHRRRSAVAMDGETSMEISVFMKILEGITPKLTCRPFSLLAWPPRTHLLLFVHRVADLQPGLYLLARENAGGSRLRAGMRHRFLWEKVQDARGIDMFFLAPGDYRQISMKLSCMQDIASDGCFSAAMLTEFRDPLERQGHGVYPQLFWECGMIGQMLYLGAEVAGLRGTGIGCFFDDPTHELVGLEDLSFQDLYHFTVGGPLEDARLTTLPPYSEPRRNS